MNRIDRAELDAVRNHISNIPSIGAMYAPVLIKHCCALLDDVERLTALHDDLLAWSQRFSDLVGVDGSTEAGRDEAFAKLYDAAKASGKLVKE